MAFCCAALNCCGDDDRKSEHAVPVMKMLGQLQKPAKEMMPLPEEEEDMPLPAPPAAETKLHGATASMGVRYTVPLESSPSRQFGLDFELADPLNCLVGGIKEQGQAASWNYTAPQASRIRRFDCVRRVNGKSGHSKELVEAMIKGGEDGEVNVEMERPTAIEVQVTRSGRKLGLIISPSKCNLGLIVRGIEDSGAIAKRNKLDGVDYVKAGDRIVAVDGQFLTPSALAKALLPDAYTLTVYRYFPDM
mmetsp:Transcript_56531/g.106009  ORF Transcript_56531/g.106009 Transcript_56531/m.106009 type:complete len:248 (+) Transcript_56531:58-801(+)